MVGGSTSHRELLRQIAQKQDERELRALQELEAEAQQIGSQLGNLVPEAATKAREAEEARQAGQDDEAQTQLDQARDLLVDPARQAQTLTAALAAIHAQRGRLNLDRDLFEEAAGAFFDALGVVPFAEADSRVRYEVLFWRSTNVALIAAKDFAGASKLLEPSKGLGLKPNVVTFSIYMHKARDYDQAKGVLDQMLAAGVAPNEVTATTLAIFMTTVVQATWATQRLNPHRATGPAYFNKVLAQLAPQHEATELLGWAFSTATALGFRFPVGSFDGCIRAYQKIGRIADAVRIAWAFPHLDGSRKLLAEERPAYEAILLARFVADDDEQRHVSYALAVLHEIHVDAGEARRWAEVSLGYDQPPQRVDDLRRIIAGRERLAPGTAQQSKSRAR